MKRFVSHEDRLTLLEMVSSLAWIWFYVLFSDYHLGLFFKSTGVRYWYAGIDYILTLVKVPSSSGCVLRYSRMRSRIAWSPGLHALKRMSSARIASAIPLQPGLPHCPQFANGNKLIMSLMRGSSGTYKNCEDNVKVVAINILKAIANNKTIYTITPYNRVLSLNQLKLFLNQRWYCQGVYNNVWYIFRSLK